MGTRNEYPFSCDFPPLDSSPEEPGESTTLEAYPPGADPDRFLVAGRYLPVRRLGHGGFGETWVAIDLTEEKPVVLKGLLSSLLAQLASEDALAKVLARFRQEWAALIRLPPSPNLLRI